MQISNNKNLLPNVAYRLYILDWKQSHGITPDIERETLMKYYDEVCDDYDNDYSFDEYLYERGYKGEFYVSYREFLDVEYQDAEYMAHLCSSKMYEDYMSEFEQEIERE